MIQYPLTVRGVRTRILEAGDGPHTVLFVHGLSTRADRWRPALEAVAARGLRGIAFDLPGHGLADKGAGFDYGSPALAAYVLDLLDALDLARPHLVGTSLGGHVASLAALRAPDRFASLYLVASLGLAPIADAVGQAIRASVRDTSPDGVMAKLRNVFADPVFVTADLVREESRVNSSAGALEALSALGDYVAESLNGDLVTDRLASLCAHLKVGLMHGELDKVVPLATSLACAAALGRERLTVLPGVGHAPYIERPAVFAGHWLAFAGIGEGAR